MPYLFPPQKRGGGGIFIFMRHLNCPAVYQKYFLGAGLVNKITSTVIIWASFLLGQTPLEKRY